ncbi:phage tail protein [Clostridioides difficile]|uniref:phage tail protein n=1 Tax=Clostridioides difficile TaxID=1496 RepID=UPI000B20584C|nr:phage tail protein [Clostridioides difficile]EGT4599938.1 phage tail protein [Clostridioides difficile]MCR1463359.1 phage tail protein [Clostridioides difficile]HBF4080855.1 phage tail protein [Clostridioides difficile]HBH3650243.1 phage tail protein [Clostridioides difficile]HCQ5684530.1 phage tail protein [Clostridioides difficile]
MSWAEIYKVNSDLQGEPLNFLSYLQDLKLNGFESYLLHESNKRLWEELYLNSLYLFSSTTIREIVYTSLLESDIDNLFNKSNKLGEQLNAFYKTDLFSPGNADNVIKGMTIEQYNLLEEKFKKGYDRYITKEQEGASNIGAWFNSTFSLNSNILESLTTIDDIMMNEEALSMIVNNSNAIVALTMCESNLQSFFYSPFSMSIIGQYILKISAEPRLIRAIIKNKILADIIINEFESFMVIAQNTDAIMEIFNDLEATKTLANNFEAINEILHNEEIEKEIMPRILQSKIVFSNIINYKNDIESPFNSIENQFTLLNYKDNTFSFIEESKKMFDNMKLNNDNLEKEIIQKIKIAETLMNSDTAMRMIAYNSTCMNFIVNNSDMMQLLADIPSAMNAFANSDSAMEILVNNNTAMGYIVNSSIAMIEMAKSFTSMRAIANSSIAMNLIANNSTAMNYIVESSFVDEVLESGKALREICKVESASFAIAEKIQTYNRKSIIYELDKTDLFSKETVRVGDGNGTVEDGLGTNSIYIPVDCFDDNDTDFTVYCGCKTSLVVVPTIPKHHGNREIDAGVSLRGAKVVGVGSTTGYITFDKYTPTED